MAENRKPGQVPLKRQYCRLPGAHFLRFGLASGLALMIGVGSAGAEPKHAIAMIGEPALPADFSHLPYANPDAPKGGRIRYGMVGSFDSLNPFIVKGTAPRGIIDNLWGNNVYETLMTRSYDEPFTMYGLLAESIETPEDRSWVEFTLNPKARFSDGEPVRPEDVVFSFNLLREKGLPRGWYKKIASVEKVGERSVRFTFADGSDRELPLIVSLMFVFPEHATDPEEFGNSSLKPHVGTGPYLFDKIEPGRRITLHKNADYWGKDLPVKRGFDNFDEISVEYFRDSNTRFEAFKKGVVDISVEAEPKSWSKNYVFPAVGDGRVVLEEIASETPKGMTGLVMNTRKPVFADIRVRRALGLFLDFEWLNRNLYFDLYRRNESYFQDSELSSIGHPADETERRLIAEFGADVPDDIMDGSYRVPQSDGSGRDRKLIRRALDLLNAAGFERKGNEIVDTRTGKPLTFELLVRTDSQERVALAWKRFLSIAGINISVRSVESSQYWERLNTFDFDVIQWTYPTSLSPGNEQVGRWSAAAADNPGTFNYSGAKDPAIDALIEAMLGAQTREEFVSTVRAYDRVLISGAYLVPLFYAPKTWYARWEHIKHPPKHSLFGAQPTTWWSEE
jgi:peptide/nickel transport system substrate-binding protein